MPFRTCHPHLFPSISCNQTKTKTKGVKEQLSPHDSLPVELAVDVPPLALLYSTSPPHHNSQQPTTRTTNCANHRIRLAQHTQVKQICAPNKLPQLHCTLRNSRIFLIDLLHVLGVANRLSQRKEDVAIEAAFP